MAVLRNSAGEVRLGWRLILIILLYTATTVLLRFIPISIYTASLVNDGITQSSALEIATTTIFEHPIYSTVIGILNGLIGFLIIILMVRVIEKSDFKLDIVGLDWRDNSVLLIFVGLIFASLLHITYLLVGNLLGSYKSSMNTILLGVSFPIFIQNLITYLTMAFGEEFIFRGYIQTRLVNRFGAFLGILTTSLVFTLLHQLSYSLSGMVILSGVLLWMTLGMLYHLSNSIYLVGVFHGVMNIYLNTLNFHIGDKSGLVTHTIFFYSYLHFG